MKRLANVLVTAIWPSHDGTTDEYSVLVCSIFVHARVGARSRSHGWRLCQPQLMSSDDSVGENAEAAAGEKIVMGAVVTN